MDLYKRDKPFLYVNKPKKYVKKTPFININSMVLSKKGYLLYMIHMNCGKLLTTD